MGPFQSSAEGPGLRLTEHSKCWYHVIGHNSKAIWRFVKKIYGIYHHHHHLPPTPSLPCFFSHGSHSSHLSFPTPQPHQGNPKLAQHISAHVAEVRAWETALEGAPPAQPTSPRPQGSHLGNQFALLVHADVKTCLSSSHSNPAPKGICLHYELCWGQRGRRRRSLGDP